MGRPNKTGKGQKKSFFQTWRTWLNKNTAKYCKKSPFPQHRHSFCRFGCDISGGFGVSSEQVILFFLLSVIGGSGILLSDMGV